MMLSISFFLGACANLSKSDNLTVTNIHDKLIQGKTTVKELKDMFGKPKRYDNAEKAKMIYHYWNNYEGGVNYYLEANTDYWETLKSYNVSPKYSYEDFEGCYEYSGKNLGVKKVYFFVIDNKIHGFKFNGDITDETVAQKDKYLRQIVD